MSIPKILELMETQPISVTREQELLGLINRQGNFIERLHKESIEKDKLIAAQNAVIVTNRLEDAVKSMYSTYGLALAATYSTQVFPRNPWFRF